jgi:hypothetical protein
MKPKVFIASSSHQSKVLEAIAADLEPVAVPLPWIEGQKQLGVNILDWVASQADECNFGVFIFGPDPRWKNQVNGNVLFEYGVFVGRHGAKRCFIVNSEDVKVPVDLEGITTARYSSGAFQRTGVRALTNAVNKIKTSMHLNASLADEVLGLWLEHKQMGTNDAESHPSEGEYSIVEFFLAKGELKLRGRSYDGSGAPRLEWPRHLNRCWIPPAKSEVYHAFDAQYGSGRAHNALGVSFFSFDSKRTRGDGYFVVYGSGGIREGSVEFTLTRLTSVYLKSLGLPRALAFEDAKACANVIRAVATAALGNGATAAERSGKRTRVAEVGRRLRRA